MTNLKCSVNSCTHHKDNMCCKPNIRVDGPDACTANETSCVSYAPKGNTNVVGTTNPNEKLEIVCSANECVHNYMSKCRAENVSINTMAGAAGCSTFTKRD